MRAMLVLHAIVLGVIQGLTEFLPISSSGHLILAREALGWELLADAGLNKTFDVALHAGTLISLLGYFRQDVVRLARAFGASFAGGIGGDLERRLAWLIAVGTVPAAIAGVVGEEFVEETLGNPLLVSGLLIGVALLIWLADWRGRKVRGLPELGWWDSLLMGVAQATALAPGVSRSGITITTGLARGLRREAAARFSFLLSIPIVAGASVYSLLGLVRDPSALPAGSVSAFVAGMAAAAASGYLCIHYFLRYLQTRGLAPFVVYRVLVGATLLWWFARGV